MKKCDSNLLGSWIFGGALLVFYIGVFVFGPHALPEFKQQMLGLLSALLAGLFGFFLTGTIALTLVGPSSWFGTIAVKATGGFALFVLTLWFWLKSGLAPTVDSEKYTKGGPFPQIRVELYYGPTDGMERTLDVIPKNPGFAAVVVENTNEGPIFDLSIAMIEYSDGEGLFTETMKTFNKSFKDVSTLLPRKALVYLVPCSVGRRSVDITFYVNTRAEGTRHHYRYLIEGSRWEHAKRIEDIENSNLLAEEISPNFPRERGGKPSW